MKACVWGVLIWVAVGCTVDYPDDLDNALWRCTEDADCGGGQSCAEGNVYAPDFCRPACDPNDPTSCNNGVCTAAGACLSICQFGTDGAPVGCEGTDFTCVRVDAIRGVGVCYPVEGCSRGADCEGGVEADVACLNEVFNLPALTIGSEVRFDNLYCTATPDSDGRCPTGYLSVAFADRMGQPTRACYPLCEVDGDGPWCPPSTTCFTALRQTVGGGAATPCTVGVWGLPCEDDTHCLVGRCLPVYADGRRACTETCEEARTLGGCEALEQLSESYGTPVRMACTPELGVCTPRFDLFSLCSEQLDCVDGVECREFNFGSYRADVCHKRCESVADCGSPEAYRCARGVTPQGVCIRKRGLGGTCGSDEDCRVGVCCDLSSEPRARACLESCP